MSFVFKEDNAHLLIFVNLENISCGKHDLAAFCLAFSLPFLPTHLLINTDPTKGRTYSILLMMTRKDKSHGHLIPMIF